MCLEVKIVELTEAVRALTVALAGGSAAPAKVEQPVVENITPPVEVKKPAAPAKRPAAMQPAPKAEVVEAAPEVVEQAAVPSYEEEVKPALVMLADALNDRNAFIAFLGRFGVNSAKNLLPEQYAKVLDDVKAELAKVGVV